MILKNKISLELKKIARKEFESGMDMADIAIRLKINLQTLYNLSSKERWEKGKRKDIIHYLETEEELERLRRVRNEVIQDYSLIEKKNRKIIKELQSEDKEDRDGTVIRALIKSRADAASAQMMATTHGFKLAKDLYNIMSPVEEVEYMIGKMRYEKLKQELLKDTKEEDKSGDTIV
ncbi:MAG: hypothetical protein ACRCZ9_08790 [Fusobacteriaceae bacterium]